MSGLCWGFAVLNTYEITVWDSTILAWTNVSAPLGGTIYGNYMSSYTVEIYR